MAQVIQHRFSFFYFFITGYYAVPLVCLPLLCHARGFTAEQIAFVGIAGTLCSIFGGPYFLHLVEKGKSPQVIVSAALFGCAASFAALYFANSFFLFLGIWFFNHFCYKAVAIVDARAIRLSAERKLTFEIIRTWGSVGFIVISYLIGLALSKFGSAGSVVTTAVFLIITWLSFWLIKPHMKFEAVSTTKGKSDPIPIRSIITVSIFCLLFLNVLNWFTHAPLYLYLSIYLEEIGWSGPEISLAWTVGVIAEILLFLTTPRLCTKPKHYANLLVVASLLTCFRWYVLAYHATTFVVLFSQALHAFSFGAVYIGSMKLIFALLPAQYQDRGQGYIQAAGLGGGTLLGNLYFGYRASDLSSYNAVPELFGVSFLIALGCIPLSMVIRSCLVKE